MKIKIKIKIKKEPSFWRKFKICEQPQKALHTFTDTKKGGIETMGRTEARMRKELADRGLRVSAAWSRDQLEAALARMACRAERHAGDVCRETCARRGRMAKTDSAVAGQY
jgi:hypothetical protein